MNFFAFWCGACLPVDDDHGTKAKRRNSPFQDWRNHPTVRAYKLVKLLGQGGFSEIWLGQHKQTGQQMALKVVDLEREGMDDLQVELLENEAKFLRLLDCPHIIKCHQVLVTRNHLIMILEYLSGGEMLDKIHSIKHYSEAQAATLFAQVLVAVKYMHNLNIMHRDIKPENILFAEPVPLCEAEGRPLRVKLIDLGMAGVYNEDVGVRGAAGTAGFMAPEIIRMAQHKPSMDMYSLGVLLFVMLTGRKPFRIDETKSLYYSKLSIKDAVGLKDERYKRLSDNAKSLLLALLADDPATRPTAAQALDHPFITQAAENKDAQHEMGDIIRKRIQHMAMLRRVRGLHYVLSVRAQGETEEHFLDSLQKQRAKNEATMAERMAALGVELLPDVPDDIDDSYTTFVREGLAQTAEKPTYAAFVRQSLAQAAKAVPGGQLAGDMDPCTLLNQLPQSTLHHAHTLPAIPTVSGSGVDHSAADAAGPAGPDPGPAAQPEEQGGCTHHCGQQLPDHALGPEAHGHHHRVAIAAACRSLSVNPEYLELLDNKAVLAQLADETGLDLRLSATARVPRFDKPSQQAAAAGAAAAAADGGGHGAAGGFQAQSLGPGAGGEGPGTTMAADAGVIGKGVEPGAHGGAPKASLSDVK